MVTIKALLFYTTVMITASAQSIESTSATGGSTPSTTTSISVYIPPWCFEYRTTFPDNTLGWYTTGISTSIPNPVTIDCRYSRGCTVYCPTGDSGRECASVANAQAATCQPQWLAYSCSTESWTSAHPAPSVTEVDIITTTYTAIEVTTMISYRTTIPTNQTFAKWNRYMGTYSITPVWVLDPVSSISTISSTVILDTSTVTTTVYGSGEVYPTPPPFCSVTQTAPLFYICGACGINVPSPVQIYYWPDQTPDSNGAFPVVMAATPATRVVNGNTLTSPSVYVSVPTAYATNGCGIQGDTFTNALLSFDPPAISTTFFIDVPPAAGSSVYNFADLLQPVNAAAYERQASCEGWGCYTIYPDYIPGLAFPTQLTNLVPGWATCTYNNPFDGIRNLPPIPLGPVLGSSSSANIGPGVYASATPVPTRFAVSTVPSATPASPASPQTATVTAASTST